MPERQLRALRGATSVPVNQSDAIVDAAEELLATMLRENEVAPQDLVSIVFTSTPDLDAVFPAAAARRLGLGGIPLLCAAEIDVDGALARCVRVLIHLYSERDYSGLRHIYLGEARRLRTDLPGNS